MCKDANERAGASSNGAETKKQPEASQFETYESFFCEVLMGEQQPEALIVEVNLAGESQFEDGEWLGDTGSSHHIKSTRDGMIDVQPCPPGTRIRQVQGEVDVAEWGTLLIEVDGAEGKHVMKLCETLIVPSINVNLFSLQRVIKAGFVPVYGEVEGKCLIKKKTASGELVQVATMTVVNGRSTLDCVIVNNISNSSSGAALLTSETGGFNMKTELDMEQEVPFDVMEVLYLDEEPPSAEDPPPSADDDEYVGENNPGAGAIVPYVGGLHSDGDADDDGDHVDPVEPEGAYVPRVELPVGPLVGCPVYTSGHYEFVAGEWWMKPPAAVSWFGVSPLNSTEGLNLEESLSGADSPPPPVYDDDSFDPLVTLASHEWSYLSELKGEAYAIGGFARVECMVVESVDPTVLVEKRKLIGMQEYG